ncbi:MAG: YdeI/OmpD-associated family protein [Candidatus Woykebacteria bacterium]
MKIGKTLYVTDRADWRGWLEKHHDKEPEIWLIYYKKGSGKSRISYNDAVEEALCFGWIDSTVKGIDEEKYAQRFSPRNPKSNWSQANKERVRRLLEQGKMTKSGLEKFTGINLNSFEIPADILKALKKDAETWENFQKFPGSYQRVRISFVEGARNRPLEFKKRLNYLLKMTRQNKKFGIVR